MKRDYDVGYGKPPKKYRYRKGKSGNPKGRPKGAQNLSTDLADEMHSTIRITVNGRPKTITKQRAAIKRLMADALAGNTRALGLLLSLGANLERAAEASAGVAADDAGDAAILRRHVEQEMRKIRKGGGR